MAVVVFDADVLIGFLNRNDAHHTTAIARVQQALTSGERRVVSAVTYAEILIGPLRQGRAGQVDAMTERLAIEVLVADMVMARSAADLRARFPVGLSDAFVLATAARERANGSDVRIESFDQAVLKVAASQMS